MGLKLWFSTRVILPPRGYLALSRIIFYCFSCWEEGVVLKPSSGWRLNAQGSPSPQSIVPSKVSLVPRLRNKLVKWIGSGIEEW